MNIAIIDADLISRKNHSFPNLASMKISSYYKSKGNNVTLKTDYYELNKFDKVFISKVFTDTMIDDYVLALPNVEYGGSGFFYDKAIPLPYEIEHSFPDYNLYDEYVKSKISKGEKPSKYKYYTDFSIGFTTRGCFRKCDFCINKNYTKVYKHSPLDEFVDVNKKYICLLDDNILGYAGWKNIFEDLKNINKPFQYKQGMDERLLTEEKCKVLSESKYLGDFIFAFDNIEDKNIIIEKIKLLKRYTNKRCMFYVFCAFDRKDIWDKKFWEQDIIDLFERIKILLELKCIPYVMRYKEYLNSPYKGTYINISSWGNQPNIIKRMSYKEFCNVEQKYSKRRYYEYLKTNRPDILTKYENVRFKR